TLTSSGALIDGVTNLSAGLNLGFSRRLAGDQANRDMGLQFADAITSVNVLYVWVDRAIAADAAATFTWTVWQSDDNLHWTQVAIVGVPLFAQFTNRFEIRIQTTAARYLKVVTQPLVPAVTTDPQLSDILVTELQSLLSTPVTRSSGWQTSNSE